MIHVSSEVTSVNGKGFTVCDNAKYMPPPPALYFCNNLNRYQPVARLGGNLYCGTGQLHESWSKVLKS